MVSESSIRDSFQKVKEDIQDVRKSIGKAQQDLENYPDKKEFYDFIKALDLRLKGIENSVSTNKELFASHGKEHERQVDSVEKSVQSIKVDLKKAEEKRQELALQVKSAQKSLEKIPSIESGLKESSSSSSSISSELGKSKERILNLSKQLASIESRVIEMPDYSFLKKRLDELDSKLSDTKKLVKESDIAELKSELSELTRDFSKLGSRFIGWNDLSKSNKKADADIQHLSDRINNIVLSMDSLKDSLKDSFVLKKDSERIQEEIKSVRKSIADIMKSEVDLSDYALKSEMRDSVANHKKDIGIREKEFEKRIEESYNVRIKSVLGKMGDLGSSLELLSTRAERAISELSEKVDNLEKLQVQKELKKLREDVDNVKSNLVTSRDVEKAVSGFYSESRKEAAPENYSEGSETSFSTYLTAFVIIALLVLAGYYLYTQLKPVQIPSNITNPPSVILPSQNVSQNESFENNQLNLSAKNNECVLRFECTNDSLGTFNYDCYFDESTSLCRCYKGGKDKCDENKTAFLAAERKSPGSAIESSALGKYWLYLIGVVALIAFTIILFYLFKKGEEAALGEEPLVEQEEHVKKQKKKTK